MSYAAADVFLAASRTLLFAREEPKNSNAGQAIRAFLKLCGLEEGHPWCMAFVHFIGRACFGALWPLPLSASCAITLAAARKAGLVIDADDAQPGDLVFMWSATLKRHAHVYILAAPKTGAVWPTIEGNTNAGGSRDGWGAFQRTRTIRPKDEVVRFTGAIA